jgi:hypothetical protein
MATEEVAMAYPQGAVERHEGPGGDPLNGQHTVWYGGRCLGRYDGQGRPLAA